MSTNKTSKKKASTQQNNLTDSVESTTVVASPATTVDNRPQYIIISDKNLNYVQSEVENLLNDGWSIAGGVSVSMYSSPYETVTLFSQSLTKNI
jgi:hypothetical protein